MNRPLSHKNGFSITNYGFNSPYNLQQSVIYHVYHIKNITFTHMYTIRLDSARGRTMLLSLRKIQHIADWLHLAMTSNNVQTHISQLVMFVMFFVPYDVGQRPLHVDIH